MKNVKKRHKKKTKGRRKGRTLKNGQDKRHMKQKKATTKDQKARV